MKNTLTLAFIGTAFLAACAGVPKPTERLIASKASLRGAEEAGALTHPEAALQIKLAQEEVSQAEKLIESGENERADFVLMRAIADADLALVMARTNKSYDAEKKMNEKANKPL